jgi:hypothetical protein
VDFFVERRQIGDHTMAARFEGGRDRDGEGRRAIRFDGDGS